MASPWQSNHYVVLAIAAAVAFGAGYAMGSRSAQAPDVAAGNSATAPAFPGYEGNQTSTAPAPPPRTRPDENQLIADNAEREDGQPQRPGAGAPAEDGGARSGRGDGGGGGRGREDRGGPPPPPDDPYDQGDQGPYGPEDE
ncbi:MAG: hypothetical protein AB7O91_04430 [Sphingomonas sp.]